MSVVPRAPRLTGCEHHFFFQILAADSCAGRPLICLFARFFSFLFAFSISPSLFLFGTYAHSPNSALPRLLAPIAYHRSGRAPFWAVGIQCTSRDLCLFFCCCCFAPALRAGAGQLEIPLSRVIVGGGAESHTYSAHDARGVRVRARSDSDKGHPFPWIHSACQLPKGRLRNMTTKK